jgi:hypothetical protein
LQIQKLQVKQQDLSYCFAEDDLVYNKQDRQEKTFCQKYLNSAATRQRST